MLDDFLHSSLLSISNENIGSFFDLIEDGIIIVERDGTISYANESFAKFHDLSKSDLIGTFFYELISKEYKENFKKFVSTINYLDKSFFSFEYDYISVNEMQKHFVINFFPLKLTEENNLFKIFGLLKEIKVQRDYIEEEKLVLRNYKFYTENNLTDLMFNLLSEFDFGIYIKNLNKKEIYCNQKLLSLLGLNNNINYSLNLFNFIVQDNYYNLFLSEINLNGGVCENVKVNFKKDDSSQFSALISINFLRNSNGIPLFTQAIIIPLTGDEAISTDVKDRIYELSFLNSITLIYKEEKKKYSYVDYLKKQLSKQDFIFLLLKDSDNKIIHYSDTNGNNSINNFFSDNFLQDIYSIENYKKIGINNNFFKKQDSISNDLKFFDIFVFKDNFGNNFFLGLSEKSEEEEKIKCIIRYSKQVIPIIYFLLLSSLKDLIDTKIKQKIDYTKQNIRENGLFVINGISQLLTEIIDIKFILKNSLERINELFFYDYSWVFLSNQKKDLLEYCDNYNLPQILVSNLVNSFKLTSDLRFIISSGEILISENLNIILPFFVSIETVKDELSKVKQVIIVPLKGKKNINGLMFFCSSRLINYSDWDLKVIDTISIIIGSAVENSYLYSDALNKTIELEAKNQELNDFTQIVSHDLKNPINNILGVAKVLKSEYHEYFNNEICEFIDIVYLSSTKAQKLINDLLHLSHVGRVGEIIPNINLNNLLNDLINDLKIFLKEKNANVIIDNELPVFDCDPNRMSELFENLIINGVKYNDKENKIINIGYYDKSDSFTIYIRDNGLGIDRKHFRDIFQVFRRLNNSKEEGSGIGLTIVKKIVEFHNGTIAVNSEKGKFTEFLITFSRKINA